jgi:predicted metal-dependent enzyme (double-stranded beta helix superfamily)
MVEMTDSEREILVIGRDLMTRLIASDDWLPEIFAAPNPVYGQQFQLYSDGMERFCVVATVLSGRQALPIRQEPFWEIVGLLKGAVTRRRFGLADEGQLQAQTPLSLSAGAVGTFSPRPGEAVQFANELADSLSIVLHVHGGDIGRVSRGQFAPDGARTEIQSGYCNVEEEPPYDIWSIQTEIKD